MDSACPPRFALLAALLLVTAAVLGCDAEAAGAPSPDATPDNAQAYVQVRETALGRVLVTREGFTLYTYDKDTPGKSTCIAKCAEAWPPLRLASPLSKSSEAPGELGTASRDDFTQAVTYAGRALYTFTEDKAPGDVKGEGKPDFRTENVWHVARP